ncbi:MAG: calcium-binding protein, partial [Pseudorhodobacter sp.]|nr:calcium-binding protein [Frankiaceae bacterium]
VVTATCAGTCAATATVEGIRELRAPLELKGGVTDKALPFQAGPQGLPLRTDLQVPTTTSWSLPVTIGILRGTGPFLAMGTAESVDVLSITTLKARLPDFAAKQCHDWARGRGSALYSGRALPAQSAGRCMDALVGSMPSVLVDGDVTPAGGPTAPRSGLDASVTVRVSPGTKGDGTPAGPAVNAGRVFLPALYDRLLPSTTAFGARGTLDVFFEGFGTEIGFFDVLGTLYLRWEGATGYVDDIAYGDLRLDAEGIYDLLDVGYGQVKKTLEPLDVVVDVLTAPVPGITQVSQLTGGPAISLLDILAKLDPRVQLVAKLIEFQQLAANLPGSSGTELVSLGDSLGGRFRLASDAVQYNKCSATVASRASSASSVLKQRSSNTLQLGQTAGVKSVGLGGGGRCNGLPKDKIKAGFKKAKEKLTKKAPPNPYAGAPKVTQDVKKRLTKSGYVSLPSVSMPVLEDASQVMDLLLGQGDTTLLRVDFGKIGASATIMRAFGPFFAGPVPLMIQVSGTVALDGRIAVAFDTNGLTSRIEALDTPGDVVALTAGEPSSRGDVFADGFYLEDVTAQGVDTPEIKVTFTAAVAAGIFLSFFEAGVRGGVVLDLTLDAFDPNEDGKVRVNEFAGRGGGDCPFDISSGIEFFLAVFLYIDLSLYVLDKSFDIIRSPRLPIFSFECPRTTPKLAVYADPAGGSPTLTLTVGAAAAQRGAFSGKTKEAYTVRSLGQARTASDNGSLGAVKKDAAGVPLQRVEVKGFELTQYFDVKASTTIVADAGDGNDTLRFIPGQKVTTLADGSMQITAEPFTLKVDADGQGDDDKVVTADAADAVDGGAGDDVLESGAGDDTVSGGSGDDVIDAAEGQDTVSGGAGDDRLTGGAGADVVRGDSGDDAIEGGLGADPGSLFATDDLTVVASMLDGGDLLIGGAGSVQITGGQGSDLVVGGEYDGPALTVGAMSSVVDTVSAVGALEAYRVSSPTLVLPTDAVVRAQCAVTGLAGSTDVDDVSGGPMRDAVVGGGGADLLSGGADSDLVCGRGGDDVVLGDGADVPLADQGADELLGGPGRDRLAGDGGADVMARNGGPDQLRGGAGADSLDGGLGTDILLGEQGDDRLTGDTATPAEGSQRSGREVVCRETTSVVGGLVDLNGDLLGNDLDDGTLDGLQVTDGKVVGPTGAAYTGSLAGSVVTAGRLDVDGDGVVGSADSGSLPLAGLVGAVGEGDCLLGGEGVDVLAGGGGGDLLAGGPHDHVADGGAGDDLARGGAGADDVDGSSGDDLLVG